MTLTTTTARLLERNRTAERSVVEAAGFIELMTHRPGEKGDGEPTWVAYDKIVRVQSMPEWRAPLSTCGDRSCEHLRSQHDEPGDGCHYCACSRFAKVRPDGPVHTRLIFSGGADNYYCTDVREDPALVLALIAEARRA